MARANLNKSKKSLDFYYHSIKVSTYPRGPEPEQFCKFQKVRSEKGGFQLIQILGLLGMYFDAVVVEVETFFLLLFRLVLAILSLRPDFLFKPE